MISLIIPIYNQAKKLKITLNSILRQSFQNFEVIIVNDGSTDNLEIILLKYKNIFQKNKLEFKIINQENKGASNARNKGFSVSKGEYILFLDADITLNRDMLKKMKQVLDYKEEYSYVYSSFQFGFKKFKLWPFSAEKLKKMPYIHTSSLLRREHFPGFDEKLKKFQDWDLWLQMLDYGRKGFWLSEVLFKIKAGGIMSSWLPKIFYKIPWKKLGLKLGTVNKYEEAMRIVKNKHQIT